MSLASSLNTRAARVGVGLSLLLASPSLIAARYIDQKTYDEFLEVTLHNDSFFTISNAWILICTALVFIMHLGFASLEAGLTRRKNTINILYKNVFVITSGLILYALIGYRTMYPGTDFNGFMRLGFGLGANPDDYFDLMTPLYAEYTYWTDFLFQGMFAATAATIISGAVAERIKLGAFMILTIFMVGLAYPIAGSWTWQDGGWLNRQEFHDFAGSSVVHAFGGFAALACVLQLGPRLGKYSKDGIKPIIGHSMPMATMGAFLLWFGWFGFNGGSVLSAHPEMISLVLVNTCLGGAAGGLTCMIATQVIVKKPDLSMILNGMLAGLVSVTAGADYMMPYGAMAVGAVGGVLVVVAVVLLDKFKVDDPVGAVAVHGVCGSWGTIAVGFFGGANLLTQLLGTLSYSIFAFAFAFIVFFLIRITWGVRVAPEEEEEGLDLAEHGQEAYSLEG
ncbi:MAG: ammonium transporter [Verrucomicrobiota bacterium JB022]|nr:ammonium transporter [Verrucomicrobiota bacterium JB022]